MVARIGQRGARGMKSKLSEWLRELVRGIKGGWYTVDEQMFKNILDRADEAEKLEAEWNELKEKIQKEIVEAQEEAIAEIKFEVLAGNVVKERDARGRLTGLAIAEGIVNIAFQRNNG